MRQVLSRSVVVPWELVRNADSPQAPPQTHWIRNPGGRIQRCVLTSPPGDSDIPSSLQTASKLLKKWKTRFSHSHHTTANNLYWNKCRHAFCLLDESPRALLTWSHRWRMALRTIPYEGKEVRSSEKAKYLCPSSFPGPLFLPQRVCILSAPRSLWNTWWELSHSRKRIALPWCSLSTWGQDRTTCHYVVRVSPK